MALRRARHSHEPWGQLQSVARVGASSVVLVELAAQAQTAEKALFDFLAGRYASGDMNAEQLCHIACLRTLSGGCGLEDLAVDVSQPGSASNCSRKVQTVLANHFRSPDLYYAGIPPHDEYESLRSVTPLPFRLPSETLSAKCVSHVDTDLDVVDEGAEWHAAFNDHIVVRRAREAGWHASRIIPLALYFDGVAYTKNDSFVAFYFQDMRSKQRYLSFLVRLALSVWPLGSNLRLQVQRY